MTKKIYSANDIMENVEKGMSDFQIKNFVVNAQLTPLKQLQQAAMEAQVREENIKRSEHEIKKVELKIRVLELAKERSEDELEQAQIDLDLHLAREKIINVKKETKRIAKELKSFQEVLDFFNENYDIEKMIEMKDTLDIDYWVKRLSKQAAMDIVATGRVGTGNLSSMLDMPDEIFQVCIKETYALTNRLAKVMPLPGLIGPAGTTEESLLKFDKDTPDAITE
jgi:hypothetical protein